MELRRFELLTSCMPYPSSLPSSVAGLGRQPTVIRCARWPSVLVGVSAGCQLRSRPILVSMTRQPRARSGSDPLFSLSPQQRAAQIRYGLNWEGTALQLQYDRLKTRMVPLSGLAEVAGREYMSGVIDMDFFITVVRRILRVADQAKRSGLDTDGLLKSAINDFGLCWSHVTAARNTLEHVDNPQAFRAIVPFHSSNGEWGFLMPGKSVDVHELFKDADNLCRTISKVIRPHEAQVAAPGEPSR